MTKEREAEIREILNADAPLKETPRADLWTAAYELHKALDAEKQTVANAINILAAAVCNCDAAECIDNVLNVLRGKSA